MDYHCCIAESRHMKNVTTQMHQCANATSTTKTEHVIQCRPTSQSLQDEDKRSHRETGLSHSFVNSKIIVILSNLDINHFCVTAPAAHGPCEELDISDVEDQLFDHWFTHFIKLTSLQNVEFKSTPLMTLINFSNQSFGIASRMKMKKKMMMRNISLQKLGKESQ